jgi:hypothetical protein
MAKKNFTFSLDTEIIEKAKKEVENDESHTYASFNHFVEVAIIQLSKESFPKTIKK